MHEARRERIRRKWKDIVMLPVEGLSNHYLLSSTIKLPLLILHNTSATMLYSHITWYQSRCSLLLSINASCFMFPAYLWYWCARGQGSKTVPWKCVFHLRVHLISLWIASPLPSYLHLKSLWSTCSSWHRPRVCRLLIHLQFLLELLHCYEFVLACCVRKKAKLRPFVSKY